MTRVVAQELKRRKDEVTDGEIADDVVRNAPMTDDHFYVVPKVVE
jgi:aspartyl-tRNA(Asn)/glutamyl-tRNA(Gln) amidotransferase subunit C